MAKWITDKFPPNTMINTDILIKRKFEDGTKEIRIGYFNLASGCKDSPRYIIPRYEGEDRYNKWEVVGWQKISK